jgi:cytochrome c oxidase assembly protein subunit 15
MVRPLLILFLLGALQGAVGWIMVASGLEGDAIYVKPTRLALHFVFALALLAYTWWFALKLLAPVEEIRQSPRIRSFSVAVFIVLVIQLVYGALMAGNKAALAAPTWPDINGYLLPPRMLHAEEGWLGLLHNRVAIHFFHRGLAYLLLALVIVLAVKLYRQKVRGWARAARPWPLLLVILQALLGIFSVLTSPRIMPNQWGVFEWLALLHQFVAMLFFLSMVTIIFFYRRRPVNTL